MGVPNTVNPLFNGGSPYYIVNRSLRFRASASAYLNRTPSVAGNQQKWTWSAWVKRGALGVAGVVQNLLTAGTGDNARTLLFFQDNNTLNFVHNNTGTYYGTITTAVFRDCSAWYHILVSVDTTQATATNRVRIYINSVEQTATSTFGSGYVQQNTNTYINSTNPQVIGANPPYSSIQFLDGYLAEVNLIDGQQLTPSSFGVYDSNGIWQPIKYTGTYGTNGFYLPFSNTTSTTTLVADASGNGNNWTPNNISLTSGTTYDSMLDSPTVSNASSNYAVLNPLTNGSYTTLSGGNLNTSGNTVTNNGNSRSSFAFTTGKWYAEFTVTGVNSTYPQYGIMQSSDAQSPNNALPQAGYGSILNSVAYRTDGTKVIANTSSAYGSSFTTNDVIGIAVDADNGAVYFSKNGTFQNSGVPTSGSSKTGAALTWTGSSVELVIAIAEYNGSGTATNFGQRPFSYTPPSGYNALNTANLPQPLISNGANYMAATLYTGNGGTQTINNGTNTTIGTSFQPDFVWIKNRAAAVNHQLQNSNAGWQYGLNSNNTNAEYTDANAITGATSSGWSMNNNYNSHNQSGVSYVGWNWKAGAGTTSTNTSGSLTSTVSVNQSAGFSVATYTGNGTYGTYGHGLGVTPSMVIIKRRDTTSNWAIWFNYGSSNYNYVIYLNSSAARALDTSYWGIAAGNSDPNSTVVQLRTNTDVNASGGTYVSYNFAAVRGYSAFGSYTGNGSSDGPFVFTNFRPRWILFKRSDSAQDWMIIDSSRDTYNVAGSALWPDLTNYENQSSVPANSSNVDFLSNGFKIRNPASGSGYNNASGGTYIYAAFAENPFSIARAR